MSMSVSDITGSQSTTTEYKPELYSFSISEFHLETYKHEKDQKTGSWRVATVATSPVVLR